MKPYQFNGSCLLICFHFVAVFFQGSNMKALYYDFHDNS